ncbi:DUF4349 domain-containing protein [Sphaerisporangium corydalis]|uniref:DUF4349 domain-containing protein n=1 Tax=Sphaerisporangium corydalis TaxID=1441875 RepID=UPI0036D3E279
MAVALAAVVLTLSGCGGADSQSSDGGGMAAAPVQNQAAQPERATAGGVAKDAGVPAPKATSASGAPSTVEVEKADRAIVYTGEMTVRVKDVAAASDRAKQTVTAAGGRLDREQAASYSGEDTSTLVFKIPPANYPGIVDRLGKELGKRQSINLGTDDVTQQVADVESRVKSARSSLEQVRTFLAKAKTITEVLEVEREISSREADLESLQAQQTSLASQTAMGTLTLRLVRVGGPPTAKPKAKPAPNFLSGLKSGWGALTGTTRVVLTVIGALLPWLVVLAVLWIAYAAVRRRVPSLPYPARRRRPAPGVPPADARPPDAPEPSVPAAIGDAGGKDRPGEG